MRAVVDGKLPDGVTAKDIILAIIGEIGTAGGTGYALEYAGEAIRALSMEGRMTVCNMSVEAGAKAGFIAPDEKAYAYLKDRPKSPKGKAWDEAMRYWETLRTDDGAHFDREIRLDAAKLPPLVTWGTNPEQVVSITGRVPRIEDIADDEQAPGGRTLARLYGAQGRRKDFRHRDRPRVHRLMHQRAHRGFARGRQDRRRQEGQRQRQCDDRARLGPCEGAGRSRRARQDFRQAAGFEWREPGCSMCLAMNPDKLSPGERCASTSNRNFEGRQGYKGRTHLVSPAMAAAAAIAGHFVDVREWK